MKILTILVLLQTGVLLLMFGKIVSIEDEMTLSNPGGKYTSVNDDLAGTQPQSHSSDAYLYSNEDRLRQIIREELSADINRKSERNQKTDPFVASDSMDNAEMKHRREQIDQQLEYFANAGRISDADMHKLQMDIAQLDDAGRTEMLKKLTRALNSGAVDGRL